MGHSMQLLELVAGKLSVEYPRPTFRYVFESRIPGTRAHPDIQIFEPNAGTLVCAVEIGYTRPEKLTLYREILKIRDVRWYDKLGNIHADVKTRVEVVTLELASPQTVFAYKINDHVPCIAEECADLPEDESHVGVETTLLTDYIRALLPSRCDKCCSCWLADPDNEAWDLRESLMCLEPREIGIQFGKRQHISLPQELFGLPILWIDAWFISDFDRDSYRCRAAELRVRANQVRPEEEAGFKP